MYSLQGLLALMRAVFFEVCQRLTVVSYCMPGSPQCQVASEILRSSSFGLEGLGDRAIGDGLGGEVGVADDGVHEVVGDADGVVGVLEEDGRVGVGVGMGAVVSHGDESVGLGFFLLLALDEVDDVGMVDVEDDHLGGAASLAAGLDDAGEGVESFHKAERAAGGAAAGESFGGCAQRREIGAGAAAPLEEHAFGLGESEDGVERVFHRVDEAGGALGLGVSGDAEFHLLRLRVPVPVACRRSWARCDRIPR